MAGPSPIHALGRLDTELPKQYRLGITGRSRQRMPLVRARLSEKNQLAYKTLGDSELLISEVTLGTVSIFSIAFFPIYINVSC
jgi:hypothetical protein